MSDEKRIYILGAGSSKAHTRGLFPGIGEFFLRNSEIVSSGLASDRSSKGEFHSLDEFVKRHFGISIFNKRKQINIEEVLTYVEIELQRNSSSANLRIDEQLKQQIRDVLITLSRKEIEDPQQTSWCAYHDFSGMLDYDDTVITFNWDLLLDEILCNKSEGQFREYSDGRRYANGAQYSNFLNRFASNSNLPGNLPTSRPAKSIGQPYEKWDSRGGYFLKVHGSINWYSCTNNGCHAFGHLFVLDPRKLHYCAECDETLMNVLIPPVLNKQMNLYPVIRRIWNTAAREMSAVNHIIVWGYSFPSTDFYSRWLMRKARHDQLRTLTLINPAILTNSKKSIAVYSRNVTDFYRDLIEKDNIYLYESFEDFKSKIDVRDKYPHLSKSKLRVSK